MHGNWRAIQQKYKKECDLFKDLVMKVDPDSYGRTLIDAEGSEFDQWKVDKLQRLGERHEELVVLIEYSGDEHETIGDLTDSEEEEAFAARKFHPPCKVPWTEREQVRQRKGVSTTRLLGNGAGETWESSTKPDGPLKPARMPRCYPCKP